eukprot:CAMPEP_0171128840 /NCGR_PEP_ID=MMETSP0766_2-20121228/117828_1 /TAXON_ID=439317 /ORGANISM="Gambierdiscus australes, Strain CAWD 149" /LENGTH=57 /DNA_ID=CAMNT_0011592013 /DNA_START=24 /DNA_END=197 /DNA_ORIENTATION=-
MKTWKPLFWSGSLYLLLIRNGPTNRSWLLPEMYLAEALPLPFTMMKHSGGSSNKSKP